MSDTLYTELEDKELAARILSRQHPVMRPQLQVFFKPAGTCLPRDYASVYHKIRDMEINENDVFVNTFPKCGTTWTQEMVWLIGNDLDYEGAKTNLNVRFPHLEFEGISPEKIRHHPMIKSPLLDVIINRPSPRYIKSHLYWELLPKQIETKKPKIIYVTRNPKDQCVSLYHFNKMALGYQGTMDEFVQEEFITDIYNQAPYWPHLREMWKRRNEPNIFFLRFEDLKKDLPGTVRKIAAFLGKTFTEEQYTKLVHHLSFESMKTNEAVNNDEVISNVSNFLGKKKEETFIRKGKVDSWKEELSQESIQKLDAWIAKNRIDGIWENI